MIRINLLPVKAAQKKEKLMGQLLVVAVALIIAVGVCAFAYMHILGKVQDMQAEIDRKRQEISRLQKTIGQVNQFKKRQQELQAKLDVLDKLQAARTGPVYLLDALEKAMPEKLWLTDFKESGGSVSIKGVGINEEAVALFMRSLETSNFFSNIELKITQQSDLKGSKFQKFDLTGKVENTAPK